MKEVPVKFIRFDKELEVPSYQTEGAAGFDLSITRDISLAPGRLLTIETGFGFEVPEGYELQIRPRSGLSSRTRVRIANSPGTIDSDYRGEVILILENILTDKTIHSSSDIFTLKRGDRVAQAVLAPVTRAKLEEAEVLSESDRGEEGLGSTGA